MSKSVPLPAFRLGDVRGLYPEEINEAFAERFAHAFVRQFAIKGSVAVGRDMRSSSVALQDALHKGLANSGVNIVNLGLCTTELGYFASSMADIAAVIIVTASHNPPSYNGFKCVLHGGIGIHFDTGLHDVMRLMQENHVNRIAVKGQVSRRDYHAAYIAFLQTQVQIDANKIGKIALNGLNGTASTLATDLAYAFELPTGWFRKDPGPIPEHGADPDNPKLRQQMAEFMRSDRFSLGVAWDGDCDRCVFFDGQGGHVSSYYVVALLANHILQQQGPGPIVFDTKVCWNLLDVIERHGATPVPSKTGHAFMKESMKKSQAIYGGERSSHHYFREFFSCDSGMYAWLKVVEMMTHLDASFETIVAERRALFSCSREISVVLENINAATETLLKQFSSDAQAVERIDGVAFDMNHWRFSMKESKTESCIRLNFESKGAPDAVIGGAEQVLALLEPYRAEDVNWQTQIEVE